MLVAELGVLVLDEDVFTALVLLNAELVVELVLIFVLDADTTTGVVPPTLTIAELHHDDVWEGYC